MHNSQPAKLGLLPTFDCRWCVCKINPIFWVPGPSNIMYIHTSMLVCIHIYIYIHLCICVKPAVFPLEHEPAEEGSAAGWGKGTSEKGNAAGTSWRVWPPSRARRQLSKQESLLLGFGRTGGVRHQKVVMGRTLPKSQLHKRESKEFLDVPRLAFLLQTMCKAMSWELFGMTWYD